MITTFPSGPVYAAATWVRIACRLNHSQPQLLQYRWTGTCDATNTAVFNIDDPFLDEQGWAVIWVKTTPVDCLDHFRCTVHERDEATLTEIASDVFILQHISGKITMFKIAYPSPECQGTQNLRQNTNLFTALACFKLILIIIAYSPPPPPSPPPNLGVGMSLPDNFFLGSIPNNSAVIFQPGMPQEVICHSAHRSSCAAGHWMSVGSNTDLGSCDNRGSEVEVATFNSLRLDLNEASEQGVYSCVVYDEREVEQKLFVGVYHSGELLASLDNWAPPDTLLVADIMGSIHPLQGYE